MSGNSLRWQDGAHRAGGSWAATNRRALLRGLLCATALAGREALAQARRSTATSDSSPAVVSRGRIDPRRDVNFSALVIPESVYVGQQATYQIGVFLSEDVGRRLRRNPEFVPPDVRSMLTYDVPSTTRPLSRDEAGKRYDVHVFQRALFPLTPGVHSLAAARLTYALPLSNSIFSREETYSARTSALAIIARDPPLIGRPPGFEGAVGRLTVGARVDTPSSRVGDPVTLTVTVSGVGNVSLFPRPSVVIAWGDAVTGAERVTIDSTATLVQGRKEFEWVVTPRREGSLQLPTVRYPYFNPYSERYEIAVTDPLSLRVSAGTLAQRPLVASDSIPRLSLRTHYRGALAPPLASSPVLWLGLAAIPLPALALGLRRRPKRTRRVTAPDRLRQMAEQQLSAPAETRRLFAASIGERTGVGPLAFADGALFVRTLRRIGVSSATARRAHLVLAELDRATYGGASLGPGESSGARAVNADESTEAPKMTSRVSPAGPSATSAESLAERALATYRAIDEEAIPSSALGFGGSSGARIVGVLCVASLAGAGLAMADASHDLALFGRGVAFYEVGNFEAAMREFRDITKRTPRAADAWANLGTAGFQANDTAASVVGWQHALRLEPLADDVRARLESSPGFVSGLLGDIPPVPPDAVATLGALLWMIGWGLWAHQVWKGRRDRSRIALGAIGAAALLMIATLALSDTLTGRHHVVVLLADRLRTSPALSAELASEVSTGEAGREVGRQGVWTRLRFSDGRVGWMESRRLDWLHDGRGQ